VYVTWNGAAASYSVSATTDGEATSTETVSDDEVLLFKGLTPDKPYLITVTAHSDGAGPSEPSDAVAVTPYVAPTPELGTPVRDTTVDPDRPRVWEVPISVPAGSSESARLRVTSSGGEAPFDVDVPTAGGDFIYRVAPDWGASTTVTAQVCVGEGRCSAKDTRQVTNTKPVLQDGYPQLDLVATEPAAGEQVKAVASVNLEFAGDEVVVLGGMIAEARWRLVPEGEAGSDADWLPGRLPNSAGLNSFRADVVVDPSRRYSVEIQYRLVGSDTMEDATSTPVQVVPYQAPASDSPY
jgi:hypothetical protein